jgi:hypothetical protein
MLSSIRSVRKSLPLFAGLLAGLLITWTTVYAAAALPNLWLTSVTNGQTVSGVTALAAQADAAGFAGLTFQVSGQNVGSEITSGSCTTSWDTRTVGNGTHTVTAVARDSVGNTVWAAPVTVTVQNTPAADTIAPTVTVTSPAGSSTVTGTITASASAVDDVAVEGVWFTLDGANLGAEVTSAPYQVGWTSTTSSNGTHVLRALARDAAGNTATSAPVTITVNNAVTDTTAPSIALSAPSAGATVSDSVTVAASANDNVGVATVQFTLDGANLGSADTTAPYAITWNTTGVSNGAHTLRAVARDVSGNSATSGAVTITVSNAAPDTTHPNVAMTSPSPNATVSGTIGLAASASDNVGVASVRFTIDGANVGSADTAAPYAASWNTIGTTNGTHVIRAVAQDAAGNQTTSASVTVTVSNTVPDTTSPSVSLTAPSAGATVSGAATVAATASDNIGIVLVQFTLDGAELGTDTSAPYAITWSTTGVSNGRHTLRAIARDAAGNSRTSSRSVTVNNPTPDSTAPSISLTAPAISAVVSGYVTVSASASDNIAVTRVQFTLDGAALGGPDTSAPFQITWNTTGAANGIHILSATASDAAGNSRGASSRAVTVSNAVADATPPVVTLTSPAANATVSGDVLLAADASDNVGVVGVQFKVNGVSVGAEDTAAPYRVTWSAAEVPNGTYQVTAVARDAAGNVRTSPAVAVNASHVTQNAGGVAGDLDGDGRPDLLFQHTNGALYTWSMRGDQMIGGDYLTPDNVPLGWQVAAIDDFTHDGKSDLLIQQQQTGEVQILIMDGRTRVGNLPVLTTSTPWRISATGDLNGDGLPDIVWQLPATGQLYASLMDGATVLGQAPLSPAQVNPNWHIVGIADMDEDARKDLVWQNYATGELVVWFMNGLTATRVEWMTPGAVNPTWRIKAVADFDEDGSVDLVWQNTQTGYLYIWYMDGLRLVRDGFLNPAQVVMAWQIVGGK